MRINVDLAIFQPYLDLNAGDNQSLKIKAARPGIEPRSSCSASQELNHSAIAAQSLKIKAARPGIEPRSSCSASIELNHSAIAAPNKLSANVFRDYLIEKGLDSNFEDFNEGMLDGHLAKFYIDARKKMGRIRNSRG